MSLSRYAFRIFSKSLKSSQINQSCSIKRWVAPTLKELHRRREKIGPEAPTHRSTFLEWNYDAEIYAFGKRLGEEFDETLLRQALTQRAYANLQEFKAKESGTTEPVNLLHNTPLIKEGDKIVSDYIRKKYTAEHYPNVIVEAILRFLTNETQMAAIAKTLGLTDLILSSEFPVSNPTLAETTKAIVAALKHSQSLECAEKFVDDLICNHLNGKTIDDIWCPEEPLKYLESLLEKNGRNFEARLCNQSASGTILANYQVGLYENRKCLGIGWGESIDIAKDTAALDAIYKIYETQYKNI